jgi:hypothetical protein
VYSTTSVPQTITPKANAGMAHDHLPGSLSEGIQFTAPPYSAHAGHQYTPKYTRQSDETGHST